MQVLDKNKVVLTATQLRDGGMLVPFNLLKKGLRAIEELHEDKGIGEPRMVRLSWEHAEPDDEHEPWFAMETEYKVPINGGQDEPR